jgi:hypothetical protein
MLKLWKRKNYCHAQQRCHAIACKQAGKSFTGAWHILSALQQPVLIPNSLIIPGVCFTCFR